MYRFFLLFYFTLNLLSNENSSLKVPYNSNLIIDMSVKEVQKFVNNSIKINFGIKAYKISYITKDDNNLDIKTSGLMVVPTNSDKLDIIKEIGFSTIIDCHSTIFKNTKAPSVNIDSKFLYSAILYSAKYGFVTLQPDFIGFGDSSNHYPTYMLQKSSANDILDFLKASIAFAKQKSIPLNINSGIYLSGYSQGAYVALGALSKLQKSGFKINATSAMAGVYHLVPIVKLVLSYKFNPLPSYIAAIFYSYSKAYNIPINTLIKKPYSSRLSKLFNSKYSRKEIDKNLTPFSSLLIANNLKNNFKNSKIYKRLLENSVIDFTTKTPINLIHCKGDSIIPFKASVYAKRALEGLGSKNINLIAPEEYLGLDKELDHTKCANYAYKISAKIFSKMRLETLSY